MPRIVTNGLAGNYPLAPWNWIKHIELHETASTFTDIAELCTAFPGLESLAVQSDLGATMTRFPHSAFGSLSQNMHPISLSEGLTKLEHLRTLDLDIHHVGNFLCQSLGPSGFLEGLQSLNKLETLRVPVLYFMRQRQTDEGTLGPDLDAELYEMSPPDTVLPRSLTHLTITADICCLNTPAVKHILEYEEFLAGKVMSFLEALVSSGQQAFPGLREVVYRHGVEDPTSCRCRRLTWVNARPLTCSVHFSSSQVLPWTDLDGTKATRLEAVVEGLRGQGVRFAVEEETVCHSSRDRWCYFER